MRSMGPQSTTSLLSRMVSSSRIPSASQSGGMRGRVRRRRTREGRGGEEREGLGGGGNKEREENVRQSDFQRKMQFHGAWVVWWLY